MDDPNYIKGHSWKMKWYSDNGFSEGKNLFLTKETLASGIDSTELERVLAKIKDFV